jgi:hypothetical protein
MGVAVREALRTIKRLKKLEPRLNRLAKRLGVKKKRKARRRAR